MNTQGSRPRAGTVEIDPAQIVEERSRRPPPPLPGRTVEVQAVQIVDEESLPQGATVEVQAVQIEHERALSGGPPSPPPDSRTFLLTTEEVSWDALPPIEADLLMRFTFGATVEAVVRESGQAPGPTRALIERLIQSRLLVAKT